jgi:hypothetical protein
MMVYFGASVDLIFAHDGAFPPLEADSSYRCQNRRDANKMVSGRREDEEPFNQVTATVPGLTEATSLRLLCTPNLQKMLLRWSCTVLSEIRAPAAISAVDDASRTI